MKKKRSNSDRWMTHWLAGSSVDSQVIKLIIASESLVYWHCPSYVTSFFRIALSALILI